MNHRTRLILGCTLSSGILSCGETVDVPNATFGNETGSYETGYTLHDVGPGELASGECVAAEKNGAHGNLYQCKGLYGGNLRFIFNEILYTIPIPDNNVNWLLGDEPYQFPRVMACCGDYDNSLNLEDQKIYGENCILDSREQGCAALHTTLSQHIAKQLPGAYKSALTEIRNYVDEHFSECVFGLGQGEYPLSWLGGSVIFAGEWNIGMSWAQPSLFGDVGFEWNTLVNEVYAPAGPITCEDLKYNNTILAYTDPQPLTTVTDVDLEDGGGTLLGPVYGGSSIFGSSDFASLATSCTEPVCSYASFSEDRTGEWSIDTMVLFADGDLVLTNGSMSETIENVRVELMGSAAGTWAGTPVAYEVQAREAVFLVAGEAAGEYVTLIVTNTEKISASELGGEWSFDRFEIEYTDDNASTWTVAINASMWQVRLSKGR